MHLVTPITTKEQASINVMGAEIDKLRKEIQASMVKMADLGVNIDTIQRASMDRNNKFRDWSLANKQKAKELEKDWQAKVDAYSSKEADKILPTSTLEKLKDKLIQDHNDLVNSASVPQVLSLTAPIISADNKIVAMPTITLLDGMVVVNTITYVDPVEVDFGKEPEPIKVIEVTDKKDIEKKISEALLAVKKQLLVNNSEVLRQAQQPWVDLQFNM